MKANFILYVSDQKAKSGQRYFIRGIRAGSGAVSPQGLCTNWSALPKKAISSLYALWKIYSNQRKALTKQEPLSTWKRLPV